MMLNDLDTFRPPSNIPFPKRNHPTIKYRFEWANERHTLNEIQKFRAIQFSEQFNIQFPNDLDQDDYDFNCQHAILRNAWTNEIVAYTRVRFFHGFEVAQSYSQQEFKIDQIFLSSDRIVEMGRTCVHSKYRFSRALSILWSHIFDQFIIKVKADYLIGCVSIKMLGNEAKAYYTHHAIQALPPEQSCDIHAKNTFELAYSTDSFSQKEKKIPKLFDVYLKMNGRLSKQAFYDRDFNCLDYFVLMDVKKMRKTFRIES